MLVLLLLLIATKQPGCAACRLIRGRSFLSWHATIFILAWDGALAAEHAKESVSALGGSDFAGSSSSRSA
jgi:hypothetical protein